MTYLEHLSDRSQILYRSSLNATSASKYLIAQPEEYYKIDHQRIQSIWCHQVDRSLSL